MEWIEGESLRTLEQVTTGKGRRIPPAVAFRVIADACAGLHAVHQACGANGVPLEIVHRDVSPQNILVDVAGYAKLIDFGVARSRDRIAGDTSTGGPKGKMRYMAPEQALGNGVDRRADVWSMGAVLYSLLEGRVPFDADSDASILRAILDGRRIPAPSAIVPQPVVEVVMRSLRVDPADRYATAAEMKRALEEAMRAAAMEATTTEVAVFLAEAVGTDLAARKALVGATLSGQVDPPGAASERTHSVRAVPAANRVSADSGAKSVEDARTVAPTSLTRASSARSTQARTRRLAAYAGAGRRGSSSQRFCSFIVSARFALEAPPRRPSPRRGPGPRRRRRDRLPRRRLRRPSCPAPP
jgi:serine/threonine-protein kinase